MGLVLDTSILISAERQQFDLPAFLEAESPAESLFIAAVTASELLYGVHRSDRKRRRKREVFVEEILATIEVLPFDLGCARAHSALWAKLDSTGDRIGPHDMLIAATCLTLNHSLATLNEKEFQKVAGLSLANARPYATGR